MDTLRSRTQITTNALEGLKVVEIIERIYSLRKLNKKEKDNNIQSVSQEEFDKVIKNLLNTPPRKDRKGKKYV